MNWTTAAVCCGVSVAVFVMFLIWLVTQPKPCNHLEHPHRLRYVTGPVVAVISGSLMFLILNTMGT